MKPPDWKIRDGVGVSFLKKPMNWTPDNPPLFNTLLAWCADEADKAVITWVRSGEFWFAAEDGKLKVNFVTDFDIHEDGLDDLLHSEVDVVEACRLMLKRGYSQEDLAAAFESVAKAIREM